MIEMALKEISNTTNRARRYMSVKSELFQDRGYLQVFSAHLLFQLVSSSLFTYLLYTFKKILSLNNT